MSTIVEQTSSIPAAEQTQPVVVVTAPKLVARDRRDAAVKSMIDAIPGSWER